MKNSVKTILGFFYPNKCPVCDEIISEGQYLCKNCSALIERIDFNDFCITCGFENDICRCKHNEFHFEGSVSAFKNTGVAKKTYYAYKLARRENLAEFFAQSCADAVKEVFDDIKFDALVCVPTAGRSLLKRGFDHNVIISRRIAQLLGIRFYKNVLKCRHFKPMQHKSKFEERFRNVRGKYYAVHRIKAKTVLLFDDIHTTGATLDESAKELMFAGAKKVYCASVLSTANKK